MGFYVSALCTYLILLLPWTESKQGTSTDMLQKHYDLQQQKNDKKSLAYEQKVLLQSQLSGQHVQILKRRVNAKARQGNENAHLVIESASFGVIRIRSYLSHYYICINSKGNVIGLSKKKGQKSKRCLFRAVTTHSFTQYRSMRYPQWSLGFTKKGEPKPAKKILLNPNSRATKFSIRYSLTKVKKSQTKRNVRERTRSRQEIRRKRRWKERERVRQCTRATLCLLIQEKRGEAWRRRSLTKCRRAFRTNNCRRKPRRIF